MKNLASKKFYVFDITEGKYFQGFGQRKGVKTTYWSNSSYDYPVAYTTMQKCEEVLTKIKEIRVAKADHNYEVRDFQEYERTYWRFSRDGYAVAHSQSVQLKIKDIVNGATYSTDDLETALYYEQD